MIQGLESTRLAADFRVSRETMPSVLMFFATTPY